MEETKESEGTKETEDQQPVTNKSISSSRTTSPAVSPLIETTPAGKITKRRCNVLPAMPPPIVTTPVGKITKRRYTDILPSKMSEFVSRKKSCLIHSSILAMSSNKFKESNDPVPDAVEDTKEDTGKLFWCY